MELLDMVRQYAAIKNQLKEINDREKELKDKLRAAVLEQGETDDNGSTTLEIEDVPGVEKIVNQRRVSKYFDPETAERLLEEKGLTERCTIMVPILDEQEILAARYEDLLTDEDIDVMFPSKESFAFIFVQG